MIEKVKKMNEETKIILQALNEFRNDFNFLKEEMVSFKNDTKGKFKEMKSQLNRIEKAFGQLEDNQPQEIISILRQTTHIN